MVFVAKMWNVSKQTFGPKDSSARIGAKLFCCQPVEEYADRNSGVIGVVSIMLTGP
jgi:hypothetical protein